MAGHLWDILLFTKRQMGKQTNVESILSYSVIEFAFAAFFNVSASSVVYTLTVHYVLYIISLLLS